MLQDFVITERDAIIAKTREALIGRPWPSASTAELENGVPMFLAQLSEMLRSEALGTPCADSAISAAAVRHGRDLRALGFNVSQVVHDYGAICQAVTDLAVEQNAPITVQEFHILNRCLDIAIAEAVTEHARLTAETRSSEENERLGQLTHEIRDTLNTALLAFHTLKRGTVAINGSTGAVLGRSLIGLRDLAASTLSDIRLNANHQRRERIPVMSFLNEIAVAGSLHAEYRGLQFTFEPVDPGLEVSVDPQILASAVMNLLNNAFKYTRSGGRVILRSHVHADRLQIDVEDGAATIGQGSVSGCRSPERASGRTGATSTSTTCRGTGASSASRCRWRRKRRALGKRPASASRDPGDRSAPAESTSPIAFAASAARALAS